jgi:hypothetical protein
MSEHHDTLKHTLDVLSAGTAFLAFLDLLSPLFGLIATIWTLMRIAEMATGKPFAEIIRKKKEDENGQV